MKMHPHSRPVRIASAQLGVLLIEFQEEHDLTNIEMLQALNSFEATCLKYMLREERHPDHPDKPADVE